MPSFRRQRGEDPYGDPIASPDQIQHYHDLLGFDNNRPIQPHNPRVVVD